VQTFKVTKGVEVTNTQMGLYIYISDT
jgi:hypothetical protein